LTDGRSGGFDGIVVFVRGTKQPADGLDPLALLTGVVLISAVTDSGSERTISGSEAKQIMTLTRLGSGSIPDFRAMAARAAVTISLQAAAAACEMALQASAAAFANFSQAFNAASAMSMVSAEGMLLVTKLHGFKPVASLGAGCGSWLTGAWASSVCEAFRAKEIALVA